MSRLGGLGSNPAHRAEADAHQPQAARSLAGHARHKTVLRAPAGSSWNVQPEGLDEGARGAAESRPRAEHHNEGRAETATSRLGSPAGAAGEAGAWRARKVHAVGRGRASGGCRRAPQGSRARATHRVEQVERAQAVLGAREAPAHHRGVGAGGGWRGAAGCWPPGPVLGTRAPGSGLGAPVRAAVPRPPRLPPALQPAAAAAPPTARPAPSPRLAPHSDWPAPGTKVEICKSMRSTHRDPGEAGPPCGGGGGLDLPEERGLELVTLDSESFPPPPPTQQVSSRGGAPRWQEN